jgi:hypothetical protein
MTSLKGTADDSKPDNGQSLSEKPVQMERDVHPVRVFMVFLVD